MDIVAICVILMLILFFLKVPIYMSILIPSAVYFIFADASMLLLPQRMISGIESIPILAVPFFIMASAVMNYTGITKRILRLADALVGHMQGGLAQINILVSTMMGGLSGSNLADAAMDCKMLVPQMTKRGYPKGFSAAVTAASALITPIIPPGLCLIVFAFVANCSVGRMFMAGVLPGIVMCIVQMFIVTAVSKKRGYMPSRSKRASFKEVAKGAKDGILALLLPVVIIGGIRLGIFTATEAGAIAVVYALFLGTIIYREMTWKHFKLACVETITSVTSVMLIIAAAKCFAYFVSNEQIAVRIADWLFGFITADWEFLILINVVLLIAGMFMEGNALLILLVPLCMPIVEQLGIDPIHFGIVFVLNMSIGTITPPVGTVMFTTCNMIGVSIQDFLKDGWPMYVALLVALIVVTMFPQVTLWLPNLIYGVA